MSLGCLSMISIQTESVEDIKIPVHLEKNQRLVIEHLKPTKIEYVTLGGHYKHREHSKRKHHKNSAKLKRIAKSLDETCGRRHVVSYIAGGRDALLGEYPSYVSTISLKPKKKSSGYTINRCGGTILSPYHVVTAAHCVEADTRIFVKPTIHRPNNIKSMIEVAKICVSGAWRPNSPLTSTDLAVYKLKQPIKFNSYVQSACLPKKKPDGKSKMDMIGLGLNSETTRNKGILQVLPVKQTQCSNTVPADRLCFNSAKKPGTMCYGDSGGPILGFQDGKVTIFGVNHAGPKKCQLPATQPSFAMNTYIHSKEILQLIQCSNKK